MLILERKLYENILIGDAVTVTVVQIRDGSVRLGITAPPEILVDREEIRARRDRERRAAGGGA